MERDIQDRECAVFLILFLSSLYYNTSLYPSFHPQIWERDASNVLQRGMFLQSNIKHKILKACSCIKDLPQSSWLEIFIGRGRFQHGRGVLFFPRGKWMWKKGLWVLCWKTHSASLTHELHHEISDKVIFIMSYSCRQDCRSPKREKTLLDIIKHKHL